ncbi:MAG: ParM/StbA family protein [Cyanobacteria bacterium P01_C01_bin.38]
MTIDLGSSKSKIVVQESGSNFLKVLLMDAQIADVGKKSLQSVPSEGLASERSWVGFNASENNEAEKEYYAVGSLARDCFGGLSQLHELKYELALPKILAAVWLAMDELSLPARFNLNLAVLLPSGEVSDKDILKSRLASCLKDFDTPSGRMKIKLKGFQASPEGSGIYFSRVNALGDELNSKNIICAMLGFRNSSAFTIRAGVSKPGNSKDFGMHWLLQKLSHQISGLDVENPDTIQIIAESAKNSEILKKLSRKSSPADIESDYQSISEAINNVKEEYSRVIVRWLKSLGTTDEIIFCGGTAEYLRPELENYGATDSTQIVWHGGVSVPDEFEALLGSSRLADVWAFHAKFMDSINSHNAKLKNSTVNSSFADTLANASQQQSSTTDDKQKAKKPYKSVVPGIKPNIKPDAKTNYNKHTERPSDTVPPIGN